MRMLNINQVAPNFTTNAVVSGGYRNFALTDLRGRYVLLVFYPADFRTSAPRSCRHSAIELRNSGMWAAKSWPVPLIVTLCTAPG